MKYLHLVWASLFRKKTRTILTLVSIMEAFPKFFEGLADLDQGVDPTKVETPLMRDRIQRAEILARCSMRSIGSAGCPTPCSTCGSWCGIR